MVNRDGSVTLDLVDGLWKRQVVTSRWMDASLTFSVGSTEIVKVPRGRRRRRTPDSGGGRSE